MQRWDSSMLLPADKKNTTLNSICLFTRESEDAPESTDGSIHPFGTTRGP